MNESLPCPKCGATLPAGGICAACAANFLQGEPTVAPGRPFVPPTVVELAEKFPQLEILELIGKGGMGAVYKARQRELDRIVALKILPPGIGDDPAFAERFAREARALAKLGHPNIVTLFEYGRAGDGPYFFLMEFVDGVNLRQLLLAERVSPREALEIVPQICDALQFAHDHGIVHRDIKPENILLDRRGRVKVADFGLAKLIGSGVEAAGEGIGASGELTEAGKILGTPSYMAPEQTAQPDTVDHRADIYALGVVFYQMLTGELPGKSLEPPSRKVRIDVRLDEVVLRALEKNPDRRYAQASVMKTEVKALTAATQNSTPPKESHSPGDGSSFYAGAWGLVPLFAVILAFFNPWGAKAWYYFAAASAVLALLPAAGFLRYRISAKWSLSRSSTVLLGAGCGFVVILLGMAFAWSAAERAQARNNHEAEGSSEPASAVVDWLRLMDDGRYAASWDEAAASFHRAVTREEWERKSREVRVPLGAVLSRTETSFERRTALPGMPDGTYFVAEFQTDFERLPATETVTFGFDAAGPWRAIAYLIRPRDEPATNSPPAAPRPIPESTRPAATAAEAWLAGIDAGRYDESWSAAGRLFRAAVTQPQWVAALESVRRHLGERMTRALHSAEELDKLPGVPDGEYVVLKFESSFAHKSAAVETVTFVREVDGVWRAAGYFIK